MSKVLSASCSQGKVTAEGIVVTTAEILSEGVGSSEGVLILEEDKQTYVAKTSPDLKTTIEKTVAALNKVASILTAIGAGMTGPTTAPPPTLATDVTELIATATELETLKGMLK